MRRQRERLEELRNEQHIGPDTYIMVQEELDFTEVALTSERERQIEES
jgi:CPA1 family monovalent cation:H+ antiporter